MYTVNLRKVGGSVMLALPPALLDMLHLQAGKTVGLLVKNDDLIVKRDIKPSYSLKELLLECNDSVETKKKDHDWLNNKPVGNELI
jgi:antitoxin ChpS